MGRKKGKGGKIICTDGATRKKSKSGKIMCVGGRKRR